MRPSRAVFATLSVAFGLAAATPLALGQDQGGGDAAPNCLWLPGVKDSDVVDNYTVLFRMKDGRQYRMTLAFECYGLKFDESFYYSVTGNRLCTSDTITARSGFSCPIKAFELVLPPIEEDAAH